MNLTNKLNEIIKNIKDEWSTLDKIRYIYLEVGKMLKKDTDFFFSVDKKIGDNSLSFWEMKEIYEAEEGRDNKVICKSAAFILQRVYEMVGIKSKLVKSINNVVNVSENGELLEINHWFLAVEDDEKTYFVTLASDLPYIQNGMKTKHFAVNIPYNKVLSDGTLERVYEGEEIKHTVLSDEEIYNLDKNIGYLKNYYLLLNETGKKDWALQYDDISYLMIKEALKANKLFFELEEENTNFYKSLIQFEGAYGQKINLNEDDFRFIKDEDWNEWLKLLADFVFDKIQDLMECNIELYYEIYSPNWNFEIWLKKLCETIQEYLFLELKNGKNDDFSDLYVKNDFNFIKWSRKIKKKFSIKNETYSLENILVILDKTNALYMLLNNKGGGKFFDLFNSLAFHFIEPSHLYENNLNNGYISNYYIANKFSKIYSKIFSCNELVLDFNKLDYSEQIIIIKEMINIMFPEISKNNCLKFENYSDKYSPILNRIQVYPIKHKTSGNYAVVFNIVGDIKQNDYYFFYNLQTNEFCPLDILQLLDEYIIISDRFKSRLDEIESIEKIQSR